MPWLADPAAVSQGPPSYVTEVCYILARLSRTQVLQSYFGPYTSPQRATQAWFFSRTKRISPFLYELCGWWPPILTKSTLLALEAVCPLLFLSLGAYLALERPLKAGDLLVVLAEFQTLGGLA